jgi:heme exporter protein A
VSDSGVLLEADGLACIRGDRLLWRGISMRLTPGDAVMLTGANGIGKSSLIRILAGLLPPAAGRVVRHVRTALVDERHALDAHLPLARGLGQWAAIDGTGTAGVHAAMDRLGIAHLADVPPRYFSTGQKKRAALARLIASDAPLWLLDEPANGLDRDGVALIEALIAAHRAAGGAVVCASHLPLTLGEAQMIDMAAHRAGEAAA